MLEHTIYSVISPEGCAAILWKDQSRKADAAEALKVTAPDLQKLNIIDGVIPEPLGGAHTDPMAVYEKVGETLEQTLTELEAMSGDELVEDRYRKFRALGAFES
jgi:acetyl-CoA carboxylase carboxyl transferase subunit alpha